MIIDINCLSKNYGKHCILDNVSLTAQAGQCIGFIGLNGSGKSTLLSIIAGVNKYDNGSITFADGTICGYVPQDDPLIEELSVKDNLRLWYLASASNIKKELDNGVLKLLGIDKFANRKVSELSGGMKKRLSIGIAMADNPNVLILDEPTNGLDFECQRIITDYLRSYINNGNVVLIATHDFKLLELCDTIYHIEDGIVTQRNERNGYYEKNN